MARFDTNIDQQRTWKRDSDLYFLQDGSFTAWQPEVALVYLRLSTAG